MTTLPNGVRFNNDHYRKVYKARRGDDIKQSDRELYCFAERTAMGENGRLDNHSLYGQLFERNGKVYKVDSVNIHFWNGGYYWFVVFEDEKGSSAPCIFKNINSNCETTIRCIKKTQKEFRLISTNP